MTEFKERYEQSRKNPERMRARERQMGEEIKRAEEREQTIVRDYIIGENMLAQKKWKYDEFHPSYGREGKALLILTGKMHYCKDIEEMLREQTYHWAFNLSGDEAKSVTLMSNDGDVQLRIEATTVEILAWIQKLGIVIDMNLLTDEVTNLNKKVVALNNIRTLFKPVTE